MVEGRPQDLIGRCISVFDLDRTLIRGNSSYQFCLYLFHRKFFSLFTIIYSTFCYFRHCLLGMSLIDLHQKIFKRLLLGRSLDSMEKYVDSFVDESLSRTTYLPAAHCLRQAQLNGHYTIILSNSPSFLVSRIASFFNVDEWKATQYAVDKDKNLSHISSIMQGEAKAAYLLKISQQLGVEKENITAYSDSYLDLPFLLCAGKAIAVNPDSKLRQFSKKNRWNII